MKKKSLRKSMVLDDFSDRITNLDLLEIERVVENVMLNFSGRSLMDNEQIKMNVEPLGHKSIILNFYDEKTNLSESELTTIFSKQFLLSLAELKGIIESLHGKIVSGYEKDKGRVIKLLLPTQ